MSLCIFALVAGALLGGYFLCRAFGFEGVLQCGFKRVTGIPCPGCGGTRAIVLLLRGDLAGALYYHPFAVYLAVGYGIYLISYILRCLTKGKIKGISFSQTFLRIGLAVLGISYLLKLTVPGYIV